MKEIYPSGFAPKKAHYAPGILDDDGTLYVSGQLSVDPHTGAIPESLAAQTAQALATSRQCWPPRARIKATCECAASIRLTSRTGT